MVRKFHSAYHVDIPSSSLEVLSVQVNEEKRKFKEISKSVKDLSMSSTSLLFSSSALVQAKGTGTTPQSVVQQFGKCLTQNEMKEIYGYSEVYFIGRAHKRELKPLPNGHYDDANGFYFSPPYDHIAYRYEIIKELGRGTLGNVLKVYDHKTNIYVAIKMVRNDNTSSMIGQKEVHMLEYLRKLDNSSSFNIVQLLGNFFFRKHLCIVMELLHISLAEALKLNQYRGFRSEVVRSFAHSILKCLEVLRSSKIVHGDLKPENIVLTNKSSVKVKLVDFSSSFFESTAGEFYIQSRFYRAPEVIFRTSYGLPIDMWSFGCTLSELLSGYPLFPGSNNKDQLMSIMEVRGLPPVTLLTDARFDKLFVNCLDNKVYWKETTDSDDIILLKSMPGSQLRGPPGSKRLQTAAGCSDSCILDLIERCLEWDPRRRLTPELALNHTWIRAAATELQKHQSKQPSSEMETENSTNYCATSCSRLNDTRSRLKWHQKEHTHFCSKSCSVLQ